MFFNIILSGGNMGKKDYYIVEKNIHKITRGEHTNFLDPSTYKQVCSRLKGYKYNTYIPYEDSDKLIIYTKEIPHIRLLEIITYDKLTHKQILGSLYGLNIASELFGDIIITNNHYYIIIMNDIYDLFIKDYNMVGNSHIKLQEVPLSILKNYQRQYQEITLIVSSLRIDTVVSKLINASRDSIKNKFYNDEIILNYEPCHKLTYKLNEEDIFSIRKYGKYKFIGVINSSKKGNYIIKCYKYIDN